MSSSGEKDLVQKTKDYVRKFISNIDAKEVAILLIFGLIIFVIFKMMFGGIFGISLVVIENGPCPNSSMCPTYDKGDMFVINKVSPEKIKLGDVLVYESAKTSYELLIIHRVINIKIISTPTGDEYYYRVSGDNPSSNSYPDTYNTSSTLIPYDAVRGKTVLFIPKLGYLRLWLTSNPVVRNIVLIVVVGLGAYLIIAPDKKKEEEQEAKDAVKTEKAEKKPIQQRIKDYFVNLVQNTKKWFIELFTVKKKRIILIISCSVIIGLVIFIPVIDNSIRTPGLTTGIVGVSNVNRRDQIIYQTEGIVFFYFEIHFQQDGSWNQVLKSMTVEGIQNDTVLGVFEWYSFQQIEGNRTIGGSFIFVENEFNSTLDLTFKIHYSIKHKFGPDQSNLEFVWIEPGPF